MLPRNRNRHFVDSLDDFRRCLHRLRSVPDAGEASLRDPVMELLRQVGDQLRARVDLRPECHLPEQHARVDLQVLVNREVTGHVELKHPDTDLDPATFTGHNRAQWQRLSTLPNLLYTNGRHWALYRDGQRVGTPAQLDLDLTHRDIDPTRQRLVVAPRRPDPAPRPPAWAAAGTGTGAQGARLELLLRDFLSWRPAPIRSVRQLVRRIAPLCRLLRYEVLEELRAERSRPDDAGQPHLKPFTGLARDWRAMLFPDATDEEFADGYAQTVTFTLLVAGYTGIPLSDLALHDIGDEMALLSAPMGTGLKLLTDPFPRRAPRFRSSLDVVTRTISAVEWHRVWSDQHDPYLHLYESFLEEYDPAQRRRSGSYYTPPEVAAEMARLTGDVLRTRLDHPLGFGDAEVRVLDPAMGTGNFLHAIIRQVAGETAERDGPGAVAAAVTDLAGRLVGFDRHMGPLAIAEMRALEMVAEFGAALPTGGLDFCLANTLDDPNVAPHPTSSQNGPLARYRTRAGELKLTVPCNVVICNPPYGERSGRLGNWITHPGGAARPLLDDFRLVGNGRTEYVLQNLYVFFLRFAAWKLFEAHRDHRYGVLTVITPAGYLRGPGFQGLREYLRRTCDEGWIIDLSPEGIRPAPTTRIFPEVQQPLAIAMFIRRPAPTGRHRPARLRYTALTGSRQEKIDQLRALSLDGPGWRDVYDRWQAPFLPDAGSRWSAYPPLGDLMPWRVPGVKPNRTWVYAPHPDILVRRWQMLTSATSVRDRRALLRESSDRTIGSAVRPLPGFAPHTGTLATERGPCPRPVRVAYRSFDRQWLIPDNRLLHRASPELWRARAANIFLVEQHARPIRSGPGVVLTTLPPDMDHFKGSEGGRVLPMWHAARLPNVAPGLLELLGRRCGDADHAPVPVEDLVAYLVAVLAHRGYTARFGDELVAPGIRVPLTADPALWTEAVAVGRRVGWLHSYGSAYADPAEGRPAGAVAAAPDDPLRPRCTAAVEPDALPAAVRYEPATASLHVGTGVFHPVPPAVWEYDVGGMPVLRKWLSYRGRRRPGRNRSMLDTLHADRWPSAWNVELIELLTVLHRLVELEPAQAGLLARVVAGPLLTVDQLTEAGVFPVPPASRREHLGGDDLFAVGP